MERTESSAAEQGQAPARPMQDCGSEIILAEESSGKPPNHCLFFNMNEFAESNCTKSEPVVRIVAILLVAAGALAMAALVFHIVSIFFIPVGALSAIFFAAWWAVRKLRGPNTLPMIDMVVTAARKILNESIRLVDKAVCAGAAAMKAICQDSKR